MRGLLYLKGLEVTQAGRFGRGRGRAQLRRGPWSLNGLGVGLEVSGSIANFSACRLVQPLRHPCNSRVVRNPGHVEHPVLRMSLRCWCANRFKRFLHALLVMRIVINVHIIIERQPTLADVAGMGGTGWGQTLRALVKRRRLPRSQGALLVRVLSSISNVRTREALVRELFDKLATRWRQIIIATATGFRPCGGSAAVSRGLRARRTSRVLALEGSHAAVVVLVRFAFVRGGVLRRTV